MSLTSERGTADSENRDELLDPEIDTGCRELGHLIDQLVAANATIDIDELVRPVCLFDIDHAASRGGITRYKRSGFYFELLGALKRELAQAEAE